jgi:RNA 3'-terminal phosphate cyclase
MSRILVDGSYGEGGGRVFRDSVMYAMLKALDGWRGEIIIEQIRSRRSKPGLKNSLIGMLDFCRALFPGVCIEGDTDDSPRVTVHFGKAVLTTPSSVHMDVHGIGSAWLLFLAIHPVLNRLPTPSEGFECTIHGGTDVFFKRSQKDPHTMTPPTIYMRDVWLPNVSKIGVRPMDIEVNIVRVHRDKEKYPYAIKIKIPAVSGCLSTLKINGLEGDRDGCIKLATSKESGFIMGHSHPYTKYPLTTPLEEDYCDEHFADMAIPYVLLDHKLMVDALSEHHRSAIYTRTQVGP